MMIILVLPSTLSFPPPEGVIQGILLVDGILPKESVEVEVTNSYGRLYDTGTTYPGMGFFAVIIKGDDDETPSKEGAVVGEELFFYSEGIRLKTEKPTYWKWGLIDSNLSVTLTKDYEREMLLFKVNEHLEEENITYNDLMDYIEMLNRLESIMSLIKAENNGY